MLKGMQDLEEFCDVTLVSEYGYRIRAHKVVLASASTVMRDTLQTNEENEYQVVHMNAVKSRLMRSIVDLLYNGETKVNQRDCEDFMNILSHYRIVKENLKDNRKNLLANIIIEASVKLVLTVPSSTTKTTVKPTWQEFTVKKEDAPKDIARSVNSGMADMAVLGKVSATISMKTQSPTK